MLNLRQFASRINIGGERIRFDEPMSSHTTFKIGGPADLFCTPATEADLVAAAAAARSEDIPCFILGGGANILVGDRGIRGLVLDTGSLAGICVSGAPGVLRAGAGLGMDSLCVEALARGLSGLQDFFGMPGTLGGAIYMNARCYDAEMARLVSSVRHAGDDGTVSEYVSDPSDWAYKRSPFQPGEPLEGRIILSAELSLREGDAPAVAATMRERRNDRESKGHYRLPSAGSVFKNNRAFGRPTGAILDSLGLRGARIGDAAVSDWHANIFVNLGAATAADMGALIALAADRARDALGLELEPEVLFVGER